MEAASPHRLFAHSHLNRGFSTTGRSNLVRVQSASHRNWVCVRTCSSFHPESLSVSANRNSECRGGIKKSVPQAALHTEEGQEAIRRKNLAVFVSGRGSNFRSIHEASINGSVRGDVVLVVTNKQGCYGAEYARRNGIPVIVFPRKNDSYSAEDLVASLRSCNVDFILLAGYLKLVPAELIRAYPKSIFNIHPSLLPAFGGEGYYGMKVHKAVIASGARLSGATIHHVDEQYDTGRIVAQRVVPVLATDTAEELAARVLQEEHKVCVEVSAALCEERVVWRDDGVPWIRSREEPHELL